LTKRLIAAGLSSAALLALVGCDKAAESPSASPVIVTNFVETIRSVVVTNVVTEVVTNVIIERKAAEPVLSARRTAPYVVSAGGLTATQLMKLLSSSGARMITCDPGAVALVEASDKAVKSLSAVAVVHPLGVSDKIAADVGEDVRIVPLSSIDLTAVSEAVRALGGEIRQVVAVGKPAVRARMSYVAVRKLAERGDVRRIERDEVK